MGIDARIDELFAPIADTVSAIVFYAVPLTENTDLKLILVWLVSAALFFTIYLGFINLRFFRHAIDLVRGKFDTDGDGQISRFQALTTSLSGTVGLGNIAGVAVAISVGGPGATIWMMLMGLFGMSTKFAEVMCAVKYRHHPDPENPENISGGPMYYLRDAFNNYNIPYLGRGAAVLFAVCAIGGSFGGGNMFQANQAYQQILNVTGGETGFLADRGWLFGIGLAILVGIVIIGGIKSIAAVASKLVPVMGAIYMGAGLIVIGIHYQNIPGALGTIFTEAFSPSAGFGGLIGVLLVGVQRATFSNEAGLGSAAIVHATAKTDDAVSQGLVGMLGPFIDTIVICTVTALVIVISGVYEGGQGVEGVALTSKAFASGISWFPYILALTVFLFAYSTMITWSYYGLKSVTFLFGETKAVEMAFKLVFCACVIVGASVQLGSIIAFTDAMMLSMAIPNILGLYLLAPEIKRDVKAYIARIKLI